MHFSNCKVAASLMLAITCWLNTAGAQQNRDFIRQDDEGHLILRFAGAGTSEPDAEQKEEIVNAFVSVMVHDRLRADVNFEAEQIYAAWAEPMRHTLDHYLRTAVSRLRPVLIECRSISCRIVFEHDDAWRIAEQRALMGEAQRLLETFIGSTTDSFEKQFLIAAYAQERETQHIKVYLRRAEVP